MQENTPFLLSVKPLEESFKEFEKIEFTSDELSIGRGKCNAVVIPYLSISRNHCVIRKIHNEWTIEDNSSLGIDINNIKLGKGNIKKLENGDLILLEPSGVFTFKYCHDDCDVAPASKRIKLDANVNKDFINNMKIKFEESQSNEIGYMAQKIYNTQQRKTVTIQLKENLTSDYKKKVEQIECEYALLIYNLLGERNEVETRKIQLEEQRDSTIAFIRQNVEIKLTELDNRISKEADKESELHIENKLLKERLHREREEFYLELSRENSSKQVLLQKLEAKIKEREEIRLRDKRVIEEQQRIDDEQFITMRENELKEIAEQRIRTEEELLHELCYIKQNLEGQVEQMELQRCQAEEQLIIQMRELKKTNEEDKLKIRQLIIERQNIENKLYEAKRNSELELQKLRAQVSQREVELAALAADRIQKQVDQSSEVINSLQSQLEKVKNQLESVEREKTDLLANIPDATQCSSKHTTLAEVGELMENELQCSICAELFVTAITLNCAHTFCKVCITVWKTKKKECPICRTPITSECKSLVLDSFIEKMVQNLTEEMKQKRAELIKTRKADLEKIYPKSLRRIHERSRHQARSRNRRTPTPSTSTIPTVDLTGMQPVRFAPNNPLVGENMWGVNRQGRYGYLQGRQNAEGRGEFMSDDALPTNHVPNNYY